jgi:4-carboxymuconolactone decarboxylase
MTDKDAHGALQATGRQAMTEVLGDAYIAKRDASTTPLNQALRHLSEEFPYASLWTRDVITRRERSMVTIGMLVAMSQHHELRGHLVGALNNGCTPEEIAEVITHSCAYAGFPAAIAAMRTAEEVLREVGATPASR